nr:hypothetical protein CFP56_56535 [Quercus suber]
MPKHYWKSDGFAVEDAKWLLKAMSSKIMVESPFIVGVKHVTRLENVEIAVSAANVPEGNLLLRFERRRRGVLVVRNRCIIYAATSAATLLLQAIHYEMRASEDDMCRR